MPFTIVEQDDKFCVFRKGPNGSATGETAGCHDTREDAEAQIGAIMLQEEKGKTVDDVSKAVLEEEANDEDTASPEEKETEAVDDIPEEGTEGSSSTVLDKKLTSLFEKIDEEIATLRDSLTEGKGTLDPQTDAAGECFCGECGHSATHTAGEPCVDRFCPKCSAKMMARSKKKESLLERFREALYYVGDRVSGFVRPDSTVPAGLNIKEVAETGSSFFTLKQANGRHRWIAISSTAFLDREDEIVSSLALERSAVTQVGRGPLLFWHEKSIELGTCDFALFDGLCLIESGLWHDNAIGTAARKGTEKNPERWKISIGFYPEIPTAEINAKVGNRTVKAVYNGILVAERSQLPAEFSANPFSRIDTQGGIQMIAEKELALAELVGADLAAKFATQVDEINAMAQDKGAVFKTVSNETIAEKYLEMASRAEDPEEKLFLERAAEMSRRAPDPQTDEEKDTIVRDGLTILLESLPECEAKSTILAALETKGEDSEEAGDSDEENTEKSVKRDNADNSALSDEALVTTLKTMTDRMIALTNKVTALERDSTTRGSDFRPTERKDNVDPTAPTVTLPADKPPNKGIQTLDSMISAVIPGFGKEE